jgi:putative ABC transport system permease protein
MKRTKPPKFAEKILSILSSSKKIGILGDTEEEYHMILSEKGQLRADMWYVWQILKPMPFFIRSKIYWSFEMLKNYLKITSRIMNRHKGYSFITITGLALGMACCLLIILYIQYELSYDRFHTKADHIYRVVMDANIGSTNIKVPITNNPLSPTLVRDYPEVLASTRIRKIPKVLVQNEDMQFYESGSLLADTSIFDVFSFPFIKGNPQNALDRPFTIVMTETSARKYFGKADPVGRMIRLDSTKDCEVTGVIKDIPPNSHLMFDILVSFETLFVDQPEVRDNWISAHNFTYLRLQENAASNDLESKFPAMVEKYMTSQLKALGGNISYSLQPLTDIHLHSNLQFEFSPNSSILYIYIFSAIAFFILALACINFMNLTTARSIQRAREVGMRKVLGAERHNLIQQFLGESTIYSLLALLVAFVLVKISIPVFKTISGVDLQLGTVQLIWFILLGVGLLFFTVITAGSYPAFFLSAYHPAKVLKGSRLAGSGGKRFRHGFVIIQFVASIALVIGTWIIRNQILYMKNVNLGFAKEQVLVSNVYDPDIFRDISTLKARLKQIPGIVEVAGTDAVPGQGPMATTVGVVPEGFTNEEGILMKAIRADEDYLTALGMERAAIFPEKCPLISRRLSW